MATDDAEAPSSTGYDDATEGRGDDPNDVVGEYTWVEYLREHGQSDAADDLADRVSIDAGQRGDGDRAPTADAAGDEPVGGGTRAVTDEDLDAVGVDSEAHLGFPLADLPDRLAEAAGAAASVTAQSPLIGYDETPVIKDIYGWADYRRQEFLDEDGDPPTDDEDEPLEFTDADKAEALGFDPSGTENVVSRLGDRAAELDDVVDERTVDVNPELDEDDFFSDETGETTVTNRYDLEKSVPLRKKQHFEEIERYWVNEPYSFVILFHSTKENETKYYVVEPHLNEIEDELTEFMEGKLRAAIKYADEGAVASDEGHRRETIREETYDLLERYDLYERERDGQLGNQVADALGIEESDGAAWRVIQALGFEEPRLEEGLDGIAARPEPAVVAEDPDTLTAYTVRKLLYYLERDFIGYERIDGIKHDINVEDISCDGYNSPVFVYHSDYEQIITNIYHEETELDDFVVKLAQRSGKGISKRRPQVDATLPDGSRAQLTLGTEVSDHGTNYTIRQFKDVPFTPIDLINWSTFSLDEMAFLWLCIENNKSLIFAGGTASGKTTSLNAVSLFIPSNSKIVSIEDTREVELPQRNWIASVTRPSFSDDDKGDIDEFDLLEAALRQRPDYIVMGEVRGEEGRTLFQVMSTGHTTYTTFHADNVGEVLKRFTTDPINVSKTMFTALDLVSIQTATRVKGKKVRRNKSITEINHYDAENDEINVQDVYQWQAETDEFLKMGDSNTLQEIMFDRGWSREKLDEELLKRRAVLAYLIDRGLNTYTEVAATLQAFINDPETILALMANGGLEASLEDLREMESVLIDVDQEKEEMVPRPEADETMLEQTDRILSEADDLLDRYRGEMPDSVAEALLSVEPEGDVEAEPGAGEDLAAETGASTAGSGTDSDDSAGADRGVDPADEGAGVDAGSDTDAATDAGDDPALGSDADSGGTTDADSDANSGGDADAAPEDAFDAVDEFGDGGAGDVGGDDTATADGGPTSGGDASDERGDSDDVDADPGEIDEWGFGEVEHPEDEDGSEREDE
ncbi:ATPase, T2SS/T4P/T4SS family [Halobaculum sp. D14]|uniref:type II/IV secretion system ATPase subunit n=1 Tax=Halobaculum sp. D14 TaxID=3421642 RepID=UPI003EB724C8